MTHRIMSERSYHQLTNTNDVTMQFLYLLIQDINEITEHLSVCIWSYDSL